MVVVDAFGCADRRPHGLVGLESFLLFALLASRQLMLISLIVDIIIMFLQCLLLAKWNGLFLIIKRNGLFDLYLDDLG